MGHAAFISSNNIFSTSSTKAQSFILQLLPPQPFNTRSAVNEKMVKMCTTMYISEYEYILSLDINGKRNWYNDKVFILYLQNGWFNVNVSFEKNITVQHYI